MSDTVYALTTRALFDIGHTRAAELLSRYEYPWQAVPHIADEIHALGAALSTDEFFQPSPGIWIHRSARIALSAYIGVPAIIDADAEVRHCAYIRGAAIIGRGCVVGNSTELKNCILMDGAQAPHFNYVGDSILGRRAHMGASAVTSNVKGDKSPVTVRIGEVQLDTGFKKLGALLGDGAEIGCGSVLNPGTVIGRHAQVYPCSCVRGYVEARSIYKRAGEVVPRS